MSRWPLFFLIWAFFESNHGCKAAEPELAGVPWKRHAIDSSSRGADGVRLADVDGDGRLDIATGWEEGRLIRVYRNPGPSAARSTWPKVTVGQVGSPEDAFFCDLNKDGAIDVISCCEGNERSLFVHWAPRENYWTPSGWQTTLVPVSRGTQWMFALPWKTERGWHVVAGAKGEQASVGIFELPTDARDVKGWKYRPLYQAGWVMSLIAMDMDGDNDLDIVISDRKGKTRGCLWLENPGNRKSIDTGWPAHRFGPQDKEVMFVDIVDFDGDGSRDLLVPVRGENILLSPKAGTSKEETVPISIPSNVGSPKAVRGVDVNRDGRLDLVISCESATGDKRGVYWMSRTSEDTWQAFDISGPEGEKFDLIEMLDLDDDGDLDVLTCEERRNLGVIWYENPTTP